MIAQGDVWWADLPQPRGSEPGYRRPVVVVQSNVFNASRIGTVICVILTSELKRAAAPGNVRLSTAATGLPKESVANVSAIMTLDKSILIERVGHIPDAKLALIFSGIDLAFGR